MPWSSYFHHCVSFATSPGNMPKECIIHKHTTMCRKFKNIMCRTTDHEWSSFRKLSEKCGKSNVCGSKEAMPSVQGMMVSNKCGFSTLTTLRRKGADMEKWSAQGSDRGLSVFSGL